MIYSLDMRWRGIVLMYIYAVDTATVASVLGLSVRSLSRWYQRFRATGNVLKNQPRARTSRWPKKVCDFVKRYVSSQPCFYFEELRVELRSFYKNTLNLSICRALRFDLNLTRKELTKRARESVSKERQEYVSRLMPFYSGPDQLVFVDETSKDGRSVLRRYGWSARNTQYTVSIPFSRGKRVPILAAMDVDGFFG